MRLAAFLLAFSAASTAVAADEQLVVAYVDLNRALNEVEEGKAAKAKLKKDYEDKQKKLDGMIKDLKAKKDDFDKQAGTMKPDVKQDRAEALQKQYMELQQTGMALEQELMESQQKLTIEIGGKLKTVVERIGDRDGYTLILNIGGDAVLYHKRHKDLTDEVIKSYNQQYGSPSATGKK